MNSAELFTNELNIAHRSGVGVILTRTREPHRAIDAITSYALSLSVGTPFPVRVWNCVSGWKETVVAVPGMPTPKASVGDQVNDLVQALALVLDHPNNAQAWPEGYYIMCYPHWAWEVPQAIQVIKDYTQLFPTTGHRLVLIVPEGTDVKPELDDDITVIDFDVPNAEELTTLAHDTITDALSTNEKFPYKEPQMKQLASAGQGMTSGEFSRAVAKAIVEGDLKHGSFIKGKFSSFLRVVMAAKTDVVKRSEVLEIVESGNMQEVGGLENLKSFLMKRKPAFTEAAREFGIRTPKGLLMVGPAGSGKSYTAKAIAGFLQLPLIRFDIGKCFGSLVGESEGRIRRALKQVEAMAPLVLWMDEVDSAGLSANSSSGDSGVNDRVMATLLTFMNDTKATVFWAMTANRPWKINPAITRAGRLDATFYIAVPDEVERQEVFRIHLTKRGHEFATLKGIPDLIAATDGFSCAEIEQVVEEALLKAFGEDLPVSCALLKSEASRIIPSSKSSGEDYQNIIAWGEKNAQPASAKGALKAVLRESAPTIPPAGTAKKVIRRR